METTIQPFLVPRKESSASLFALPDPDRPDHVQIWWGMIILQTVPRDPSHTVTRFVIGLLKMLKFSRVSIAKCFGINPRTVSRIEQDLRDGRLSFLSGNNRVFPDAVETYVRRRYQEELEQNNGRHRHGSYEKIRREVLKYWGIETSHESIRRHLQGVTVVLTEQPEAELPPEQENAAAENQTGTLPAVDGACRFGSSEAAAGARQVIEAGLGKDDVLVGVAASGKTPFTLAAVQAARERGAFTVGLANNPGSPLLEAAEVGVLLDTGAEVISGSTRMAAGTAQKVALNMFSSLTMLRLGRVYSNLMVGVQASNQKLLERAARIVVEISGAGLEEAAAALDGLFAKGKRHDHEYSGHDDLPVIFANVAPYSAAAQWKSRDAMRSLVARPGGSASRPKSTSPSRRSEQSSNRLAMT